MINTVKCCTEVGAKDTVFCHKLRFSAIGRSTKAFAVVVIKKLTIPMLVGVGELTGVRPINQCL